MGNELCYPDEDFKHFRPFHCNPVEKKITGYFTRPKPLHVGINCARVWPKTEGQYGPLDRRANNILSYSESSVSLL